MVNYRLALEVVLRQLVPDHASRSRLENIATSSPPEIDGTKHVYLELRKHKRKRGLTWSDVDELASKHLLSVLVARERVIIKCVQVCDFVREIESSPPQQKR